MITRGLKRNKKHGMKSVVTGCNLYNKLQQYRENQGENGFLGNAPRNYTRHLMVKG
jgi:hypothetical protein